MFIYKDKVYQNRKELKDHLGGISQFNKLLKSKQIKVIFNNNHQADYGKLQSNNKGHYKDR